MSVVEFQDLPLADRDREWDGDEAERRVREWAGATGRPNAKYRWGFVWYAPDQQEEFGGYKLPIADVVDGGLYAVPRGVMAAAAVVQGARGGVDIPRDEMDRVRNHLAKYYGKMGETAPWDE